MKRKIISLGTLLAVSCVVQAAGDPVAGKEKAAVCGACHGADGNSVVPTFPRLAGQSEEYLAKQLKELKGGVRKDPIMSSQTAAINEADIPNLAAYFASQKHVAATESSNKELFARGQKLFMGGNTAASVPACASCHGPNGAGNPAAHFPSLAGQHAGYITTQLQRFKSGERANDPNRMMQDSAARISTEEMKAVAEFIAHLAPTP
ncbi:Cytochrome c4 [Gammaproteobacteria bacterium]